MRRLCFLLLGVAVWFAAFQGEAWSKALDSRLVLGDFEPAASPFAAPLDGWEDWFGCSTNWIATRTLSTDACKGRFSYQAVFRLNKGATGKGFGYLGVVCPPEALFGATGLDFCLKASRAVRVALYFSPAPAPLEAPPLAHYEVSATTDWQAFHVDFAQVEGLAPRKVKAFYWAVSGEPVTLWLDQVKLVLTPHAFQQFQLQKLADSAHLLKSEVDFFRSARYVPSGLDARADKALAAVEGAIAQVARQETPDLVGLERELSALEGDCNALLHYLALVHSADYWQAAFARAGSKRAKALCAELEGLFPRLEGSFDSGDKSTRDALIARAEKILAQLAEEARGPRFRFKHNVLYDATGHARNLAGLRLWRADYFAPEPYPGVRCASESDLWLAAAKGYNCVRLPVQLDRLADPAGADYADYLVQLGKLADKWGLAVVIAPDYGPAGYWLQQPLPRLLAGLLHLPNAVAVELPEGYSWETRPGAADLVSPEARADWNRWLKSKYGSDAALNAAWSGTELLPAFSELAPGEHLADGSVLPPGARGEPLEASTRLSDCLDWLAQSHQALARHLYTQLRTLAPRLYCLQRPPVIAVVAGRPLPSEGSTTLDLPEAGEVQDHAALPLALAKAEAEHKWLLTCGYRNQDYPAAVRAISAGGVIFDDIPAVHLARSRPLPFTSTLELKLASALRALERPESSTATRPGLVCIGSARRLALGLSALPHFALLADTLRVPFACTSDKWLLAHPEELKRYRAAVVELSGLEPGLLAKLASARIPCLVVGFPWQGADGRVGAKGLQLTLSKAGRWWKRPPASLQTIGGYTALPLQGKVEVACSTAGGLDAPTLQRLLATPSAWQTGWILPSGEGVLPGVAAATTTCWVKFTFEAPQIPADGRLSLAVGELPASAKLFLNGQLLAGYKPGAHQVELPRTALHFDKPNTLVIAWRGAGRLRGAPALVSEAAVGEFVQVFGFLQPQAQLKVPLPATMPFSDQANLADNCQALATAGPKAVPCLLKQDNLYLWCASETLNPANLGDVELFAAFLQQAGVQVTFPPKRTEAGLYLLHLQGALAALNYADVAREVVLPSRQLLLPCTGLVRQQLIDNEPASHLLVPAPKGFQAAAFEVWRLLPVRLQPVRWEVSVKDVVLEQRSTGWRLAFTVSDAFTCRVEAMPHLDQIRLLLDNEVLGGKAAGGSGGKQWELPKGEHRVVLTGPGTMPWKSLRE